MIVIAPPRAPNADDTGHPIRTNRTRRESVCVKIGASLPFFCRIDYLNTQRFVRRPNAFAMLH